MMDTPRPLEIEKITRRGNPIGIRVGAYRNFFPDLRKRTEDHVDLKLRILKKNGFGWEDFELSHRTDSGSTSNSSFAAMHQRYGKFLGYKFNHRYWAANHALWIGDDSEYIYRFCRGPHGLLDGQVYRFHAYRKIIEKALRFGDSHLVPSILFFGDEIGDIKKGLGKGLWKSLCRNALTRNHLIFQRAYTFIGYSYGQGVQHFGKSGKRPKIIRPDYSIYQPLLAALNALPTSLLRETWLFERNHFDSPTELRELELRWQYLAKAGRFEKSLTKRSRLRELSLLAYDTERMARRLGEPFTYEWSSKRMHDEHQRLTKRLALAKWSYQNSPFSFHFLWIERVEMDGMVAMLLKTPYELMREGTEMRHCVGSYPDLVEAGHCLIFSLRAAGGTRSTLELTIDQKQHRILVRQHTGPCNGAAPESHVQFANAVVEAQMQVYRRSREYSLVG